MKFAIIAAGHGSRLAQEGVEKPKPLVELDGQPLLGRLIDIFLSCGAEEVALIVNAHMPEVEAYARGLQLPVPLRLTVLDTPSSMHSFWHVATSLGSGKCVATTVDTVFRPDDFKAYVAAFEADANADGLMGVTAYIDDEKPLYVRCPEPEMRITGFCDKAEPGADKYVSAGIYGLDLGRALPVLRSCLDQGVSRMRNFQRALVDAGLLLRAWPLGKVIDVDHAADIAKAEALVK